MYRFIMGIIFIVVGFWLFFMQCYVYKKNYRMIINKQILLVKGYVINIKYIEKDELLYLKNRNQKEELVTGLLQKLFYTYVITEQAYYVFNLITKGKNRYEDLLYVRKKHAKKFYIIDNEKN